MRRIRSVLARGGASRGLIIQKADIADLDPAMLEETFARLVGSPDPGARQVDGVGGGTATTSKVVVLSPVDDAPGEIWYDFFQIDVASGRADQRGTCGNLTAAAAQYAVAEGLVSVTEPVTPVLLRSSNTGRTMAAEVPVVDGAVSESDPVIIRFLQPAGGVTGALFPGGLPQRAYTINGSQVAVTLIDVVNPLALIDAASINIDPTISAEEIDRDAALLDLMDRVRRQAACDFSLRETPENDGQSLKSLPFVGLCGAPAAYAESSGRRVPSGDYSLSIRLLSSGTAHRAVPLGAALACAAAARLAGTVAHRVSTSDSGTVRLGHSSGILTVEVQLNDRGDSETIDSVAVSLTGRRIMEGTAFA